MSCDHKWGDGPNEYSKTRTEVWPNLGKIKICDRCKAALKNGEIIGYERYNKDEDKLSIINNDGKELDFSKAIRRFGLANKVNSCISLSQLKIQLSAMEIALTDTIVREGYHRPPLETILVEIILDTNSKNYKFKMSCKRSEANRYNDIMATDIEIKS